jgi:hypothetical protein
VSTRTKILAAVAALAVLVIVLSRGGEESTDRRAERLTETTDGRGDDEPTGDDDRDEDQHQLDADLGARRAERAAYSPTGLPSRAVALMPELQAAIVSPWPSRRTSTGSSSTARPSRALPPAT